MTELLVLCTCRLIFDSNCVVICRITKIGREECLGIMSPCFFTVTEYFSPVVLIIFFSHATSKSMNNLFSVDEKSTEQSFAAHLVHYGQQC